MGECPPEYNISLLNPLRLEQIVFWDETHKKTRVGPQGAGSTKKQCRFYRDENGRLDNTGNLAPEKHFLKMKFEGESRFALGCAIVELQDGAREGRRCQPFVYSGKNIITISERNQLIKKEITRVRALPGIGAPWVTGRRENNTIIYANDPVNLLPRIGVALKRKLTNAGIHTIGNIQQLTDERIITFSTELQGVSTSLLFGAREAARSAIPGSYTSELVDHKKAENPYASLYGETWNDQINESVTLKGTCCITVLVEHMIRESQAVMRGTKWENMPMFYHDALTLLKCEETKSWMRAKGFLSYWVLPELGLNNGTTYAGRPVGNSPEMMPWDCSLNKDVDDVFLQHVAWTSNLSETDPKKFSKSTPGRQDHGYLRLLDPIHGPTGGVPTSKRIIQDVEKCMGSHLLEIITAKGAIVPGLGSRNGLRCVNGINQRGGERSKASYRPVSWIHLDARVARHEIAKSAETRFGEG